MVVSNAWQSCYKSLLYKLPATERFITRRRDLILDSKSDVDEVIEKKKQSLSQSCV